MSASLDSFGPQRYILEITRESPEPTATPTPDTPTPTPDTPTPTPTPANQTETAGGTDERATDSTGTATETGTATANRTAITTEATPSQTPTQTPTPTPSPTPTQTPTEAGSECYPELRYDATIEIAQPQEYTVLVTYDGEIVGAHWREGEETGSYDTIPERPETPEPETESG